MIRRMEFTAWVAAGAAALALGAASPAAAQDSGPPGSGKLQRQVDVFERFASQMLLDSPNFLVSGSQAARGIYIDCYGVLVSFNASLIQHDDDEKAWKWWKGSYKIKRDGDKIYVVPEGGDTEDGEEIDFEEWQDRKAKRVSRTYDRGKQEIVDLLLDYGDLITRLQDDQWVAVAGFLRDTEFLEDKGISHLVVKASVKDLKAYGAGDIKEDEMVSRMVVEEY